MSRVLPKSPVPLWRPVHADPKDYFSAEEVARSKAYQRPLQYSKLASFAVNGAEIVILIWLKAAPRFIRWTGIGGWTLQLLALIGAFVVIDAVVNLPVMLFRYRHDKIWNFETRGAGLVVSDTVKNTIVSAVVFSAVFLPIWALVRWTRLWWLLGAVVLLVVTGSLVALSPALNRLFNKFTPLEDQALRTRLLDLAARAGAHVTEIKVMDASKRTRKDNAFFSGLGKTKEIVVFDNLLEMGHEPVEVVVAHEIGHWRRKHSLMFVFLSAVTGPAVLGVAALFVRWDALMRWGGVTGGGARAEGNPAAFPILLLGAGVGFGVVTFITLWFSRWLERNADLDALDLTRDIDGFRSVWRQMNERNLPDLDPSWWARIRASHPLIAERLRFGDLWAQGNGRGV
ncbi:MAG: M48 family metalloprotease [Actinobacteria bacterium]|nr:M48 family metalloprotease [Actinomycetota bacterium]